MFWITVLSFAAFALLVAGATYFIVRRKETATQDGFFLAGRSLTFPFIAGSLLLTNLSTEQMVGLNGSAFAEGFAVMVWEVEAVIALVIMASFFLPKFLRSGVTTVPQYLAMRFDRRTGIICNMIFLLAYTFGLLPIILYTGAVGLSGIFDLPALTGISNETAILWGLVWFTGLSGAFYALFGGLRSVAVSDTLNGIGLLIGGLLIVFFALNYAGDGAGIMAGLTNVHRALPDKFSAVGGKNSSVPFATVFTGVLIINLFYWCTNQQIIQRTFGAKSLAEGQKGVLLCGALKLLGPLYLVLPGIIACYIFKNSIKPDLAYGKLVHLVLPPVLSGFFAAVMTGAILSSFNSALNSACTLFTLGIYKEFVRPDADDAKLIRVSKIFGWIVAIAAMCVAPLLAATGSIFIYLQQMNSIYFIPIFAVVLMGMTTRCIPAPAANWALIAGCVLMAIGAIGQFCNQFHYAGAIFLLLCLAMWGYGRLKPCRPVTLPDAGLIDLTPWRAAKFCGILLVAAVILLYIWMW